MNQKNWDFNIRTSKKSRRTIGDFPVFDFNDTPVEALNSIVEKVNAKDDIFRSGGIIHKNGILTTGSKKLIKELQKHDVLIVNKKRIPIVFY